MGTEKTFTRADLDRAVASGAIGAGEAEKLLNFLDAVPGPLAKAPVGRFELTHVLWYAGGLIIMSAMGLFATTAFAAMGGYGLAFTGIVYALGLGYAGNRLWWQETSQVAGGVLIAAAIAMVPMIVFGLQEAWGVWGSTGNPGRYDSFYVKIRGGFVPMEIATIVVSALALRRYSFSFLALPAALCLWFLSMDIAELLAQKPGFELRREVSLWFGLILIALLLLYESRPRASDAAFWIHLVAAVTFWGGLTFKGSDNTLAKAAYCALNVGLVLFATFVGRKIYAVLGVIGIMIYIGDLAWKVFKDSPLFPYLLSLVGIALVALGLALAKRRATIGAKLEAALPEALKAMRPYRLR